MKFSDVKAVPQEDESLIRVRTALLKPSIVSPLAAYRTLKNALGDPNSESFDDNKTQWCYHLQVPGGLIEVYDWKLETWSVAIYEENGDRDKAYEIGRDLVELIAKNSSRHFKAITRVAQQASSYVIQNPFRLYYDSSVSLLERALAEHSFEADDLCRAAFFTFISAFEGLMNLIYELYLKPDLRDDRIYERLAREQIDIKVRLAPVYCECFVPQLIDHRSESFSKFHSVVNLRNDFIHANLTKPMKRPLIQEDDHTFIVEPEARGKYGLPKSISDINAEDIQIVKESIDSMIKLLLAGMKPRYRREFREVLEHEFIQISIEDGETVIDYAF